MVRCFPPPTIAIYAAFLAACIPQLATSQQYEGSPTRRGLEIEVGNSDEYAESIVTLQTPDSSLGIGPNDHAKIMSVLAMTRELVETATVLVGNERTLKEGQEMMDKANAMFGEVKDHIRQINNILREQEGTKQRDLLRKKYSDHDVQTAQEDEERSLDVTRSLYSTMITFPECVERLFEHCVAMINRDLRAMHLRSTVEIQVHEKRNANQDGYNKVVIVANELDDRVLGRGGDGIVSYPFLWNDEVLGPRVVGVDGKWNCLGATPMDCCNTIKDSVPNRDTQGNSIECHIFVPFGGVGNAQRTDRIFINLSPDGRVHEPPILQ